MSESLFWQVYDRGCDHLDAGRIDAALECFAASLNAARLVGDQDLKQELMVTGAIELGLAQRAKEQFAAAKATLELAVTLAGRLGSRRLLGRAHLEIASLHIDAGDLEKARAAQLVGIAELEPAVAEIERMAEGSPAEREKAAELRSTPDGFHQLLAASREQLGAIEYLSQG